MMGFSLLVKLKWVNPETDAKINLTFVIYYSTSVEFKE
jgi:hypothetical protein